jgi:3-deoxy-D-manno-octulosonic-acid transferase
MNWIAGASQLAFKGLNLAESFIGLPKALSDSLQFRQNWETHLSRPSESPTLWIHGASVGELEDLANFYFDTAAIESTGYDITRLVVTSSSLSAKPFLANLRDRLPLAYAGPIPSEDTAQILRFLDKLKPDFLILSHSDLWPNLMHHAQERALQKGILWMPAKATAAKALFEATIREDKLKAVGVRNRDDFQALQVRLKSFRSSQLTWVGNPRLDRIASRISKQRAQDQHVLEDIRARPDNRKFSILMGSAWAEDAALMAEALKALDSKTIDRIQIVTIPHTTDDIHIVASIQHLLPMARILRIQGILLEAYQDFDLAFVGGGFRSGLHSVLEPALWGIPIVCGPMLRKQPEAPELEAKGALRRMVSPSTLRDCLEELMDETRSQSWISNAKTVGEEMKTSTGASKRLSHLVGTFTVSPHD